MEINNQKTTNQVTDFLDVCFIVKDYQDLKKLLQLDLQKINNPNIRELVQDIQELAENMINLPDLMRSILIYNSFISFVKNTVVYQCKKMDYKQEINLLKNEIKYNEKMLITQKNNIINELKGAKKFKKIFWGENISEIYNDTKVIEHEHDFKVNKIKLSLIETKLSSINQKFLSATNIFKSHFGINEDKKLTNGFDALECSLDFVINNNQDLSKLDFSLLTSLTNKKPENLLQINDYNKEYMPSFMTFNPDDFSLKERALKAQTSMIVNDLINVELNNINTYFLNNMDIDYLQDNTQFKKYSSKSKLIVANAQKATSNITSNMNLVKNNRDDILRSIFIYTGAIGITKALELSLEWKCSDLDINLIAFSATGITETVFGLKGLYTIYHSFKEMFSKEKVIGGFFEVVNNDLNNIPKFKSPKIKPATPAETTTNFKGFERN